MAGSSLKPDRQPLLRKSRSSLSWCQLMFLNIYTLFNITFALGMMVFYGSEQTYLPEVRLQRLDINALPEVRGDTLVAADFSVLLNVTNEWAKTEFVYRFETARMAAAGVELRSVKPADMHLWPHDTAVMVVHTVAKGVPLKAAAGKRLVERSGKRVLVMDVVVEGRLDVFFGFFGGKRSDGWYLRILCYGIDQTAIDIGSAPICRSQITPISPRTIIYIFGIVFIVNIVFGVYFHFLV